MLKESYFEFIVRWHLYRKWRRPPKRSRQAEYDFHRAMKATKAGSLFLDLGANVGDVTRHALDYGMRVIAFEPDPIARAVLISRFGGNARAVIIPKAVGGSARTSQFHQASDTDVDQAQGSSLFETVHNADGLAIDIEVVDIARFLNDLREPVAIVKMDIEGAEAECVEAILDAGLHHSIGQILVETHERYSPELAARIGKLRERISQTGVANINLNWG